MRISLAILAVAVCSMPWLHAGPEVLVKERAKDLRDQNNTRQGVTPTPPPVQPAPPAAAPATTPPNASRVTKPAPTAKIRSDLITWQSQPSVTAEAKKEFIADLQAAVRGSKSPSTASLAKLTDSLAAALAGKSLSASELSRLIQNLNLALNSAGLSAERMDEVAAQVQADLETAGVAPTGAAAAATELKAVMAGLNQ